jgi:hypothetical protein
MKDHSRPHYSEEKLFLNVIEKAAKLILKFYFISGEKFEIQKLI